MVTLNLNNQISEANSIKVDHLTIFRCCYVSDSITVGFIQKFFGFRLEYLSQFGATSDSVAGSSQIKKSF